MLEQILAVGPAHMYILICSDADTFDECKESALNVAMNRLQNGVWPLYKGTRNRKHIKEDDKCLIYLAVGGEWAQHIIASAHVKAKRNLKVSEAVDSKDLLVNRPDQVLELGNIGLIEPIPIRCLLGKLSFLHSKMWGAAFQGGCRRVSPEDAELLEKHIVRKDSSFTH